MPGSLTGDPLDILLAHDAWATRTLLELCRPLSRDQFHQRFEIGLGSLHDNLTHIISVMRRWTDRLAERAVRPALHTVRGRPDIAAEPADRTPDQLLELLHTAERDLAGVTREWRGRLESAIHVVMPGEGGSKRYTFSRGAVLVHVATHGTHHRAQCLNMLRHLGIPGLSDKLPEPSAADWQTETESPPVPI